MRLHLVAFYGTLLGLRELVFRSAAAADFFDLEAPGLFSGYAAGAAYQCWFAGELPLWAAAQGGGLEPIVWSSGRHIEWPDGLRCRDHGIPCGRPPLIGDGALTPSARSHRHQHGWSQAAVGFRT